MKFSKLSGCLAARFPFSLVMSPLLSIRFCMHVGENIKQWKDMRVQLVWCSLCSALQFHPCGSSGGVFVSCVVSPVSPSRAWGRHAVFVLACVVLVGAAGIWWRSYSHGSRLIMCTSGPSLEAPLLLVGSCWCCNEKCGDLKKEGMGFGPLEGWMEGHAKAVVGATYVPHLPLQCFAQECVCKSAGLWVRGKQWIHFGVASLQKTGAGWPPVPLCCALVRASSPNAASCCLPWFLALFKEC